MQLVVARWTAEVAAAAVNPGWVSSYGLTCGRLPKAERIEAKLLTPFSQLRSGGRSHGGKSSE
jgi:hypothetical protein